MTAASANKDRQINSPSQLRRILMQASANPYQGSFASLAATGYGRELVSGEPFVGIFRDQLRTADMAAADGDLRWEADGGRFLGVIPLTGVAQDDVAHKRLVYASDDDTFNMTGSGTLVGCVIGVSATDRAIVSFWTYERQQTGGPFNGFETLADAPATLTTLQLDKLLIINPGAARTLTLPAAADCTGRTFTIKTLAAQVVTIDGAGAETVDGAATCVLTDAANDVITIMSTGTAWLSIAAKIA